MSNLSTQLKSNDEHLLIRLAGRKQPEVAQRLIWAFTVFDKTLLQTSPGTIAPLLDWWHQEITHPTHLKSLGLPFNHALHIWLVEDFWPAYQQLLLTVSQVDSQNEELALIRHKSGQLLLDSHSTANVSLEKPLISSLGIAWLLRKAIINRNHPLRHATLIEFGMNADEIQKDLQRCLSSITKDQVVIRAHITLLLLWVNTNRNHLTEDASFFFEPGWLQKWWKIARL